MVRRCGKEKLSYRKEADMQKAKVDKMKAEGREEIEIRKMNEVSFPGRGQACAASTD